MGLHYRGFERVLGFQVSSRVKCRMQMAYPAQVLLNGSESDTFKLFLQSDQYAAVLNGHPQFNWTEAAEEDDRRLSGRLASCSRQHLAPSLSLGCSHFCYELYPQNGSR